MQDPSAYFMDGQSLIRDVTQQFERLPGYWNRGSVEYPPQSGQPQVSQATDWNQRTSEKTSTNTAPLELGPSVDRKNNKRSLPITNEHSHFSATSTTSNGSSCNSSSRSTTSDNSNKSSKRKRATSPQISCPVCFTAQRRMRSLKAHYLKSCTDMAAKTFQCHATDCDYIFRNNTHVDNCVVTSECGEHWRRYRGDSDPAQAANIMNFRHIAEFWLCSVCGRVICDRKAFVEHLHSHNARHADLEIETTSRTVEYTTMLELLLYHRAAAFSRQINLFIECNSSLWLKWLPLVREMTGGRYARPKWLCFPGVKKFKERLMGRYDHQSAQPTMRRLLELAVGFSRSPALNMTLELQLQDSCTRPSRFAGTLALSKSDATTTTSLFGTAPNNMSISDRAAPDQMTTEHSSTADAAGIADTSFDRGLATNVGQIIDTKRDRGFHVSCSGFQFNMTTRPYETHEQGGLFAYSHAGSNKGRTRVGEFVPR